MRQTDGIGGRCVGDQESFPPPDGTFGAAL